MNEVSTFQIHHGWCHLTYHLCHLRRLKATILVPQVVQKTPWRNKRKQGRLSYILSQQNIKTMLLQLAECWVQDHFDLERKKRSPPLLDEYDIVKLIKQWKAGGQSSIAPRELSLIFQVGREMKIVSWVQNVSSSKQFGTGKGRGRAGGLVLSNYYSYSCTALTLRSFWQCHYFIMTEHWRQTNKIQLISAEKCFGILWIRYPNKVHFQSKPQELQNHS